MIPAYAETDFQFIQVGIGAPDIRLSANDPPKPIDDIRFQSIAALG